MPDYALMNQLLYEGNAGEVERLTKEALAEGRTAQEILNEGLIAGMSVVGEDFKHNVLYVPEVLIAARAMKAVSYTHLDVYKRQLPRMRRQILPLKAKRPPFGGRRHDTFSSDA